MEKRIKLKIFLTISLMFLLILGGMILYKEQNTNKPIPKRATLVFKIMDGGKFHG